MAQLVKNPPAMQETWAWSLGWEDPLEKGKATHNLAMSKLLADGIYKDQVYLVDSNMSSGLKVTNQAPLLSFQIEAGKP